MPFELPDDLQASYEELLSHDAMRRLPGTLADAINPFDVDRLSNLLNAAGELSLDEGHEQRTMAYEIATRAAALHGSECSGIICAAEVILSRLGNFPGCGLLKRRFGMHSRMSAVLQLEMRAREIGNTVRDLDAPVSLTDFQFDALECFSGTEAVSLSAPTSAGKSFLLALEVIRKLRERPSAGIVYVVPTRALIRQVVVDLRDLIEKAKIPSPIIRSIPRSISMSDAPHGFVYVLTQERLLSLLDSDEVTCPFTALIVDEAQEIRSGGRGILLQTAIENFRFRFPAAKTIFASPLAENPERLLELFQCSGVAQTERHSPVSQNVILVEPVSTAPTHARATLLWSGKRIQVGETDLGFRFGGQSARRRMALFANELMRTCDEQASCIIYANGARDAECIARHLQRVVPLLTPVDSAIVEFADFLKQYVHKEYELALVLRHGIAFHYGNMPGSVRAGIEDLFKEKKLRFLCCTSTLLQGVNLPAQHIIIEAPKRGHDEPMERRDFLNLAGRAGRLKQEFHGNVWCLMPERWQRQCFEGSSLHTIQTAFQDITKDGGTVIRQALEDESKLSDPDTAVAALGRMFTEFIQKDRHFDRSDVTDLSSLDLTLLSLQELRREVQLPSNVFSRNSGIHPRRLESLYTHLRAQEKLDAFIPIPPFVKGVNQRLREIFSLTQRLLSGVENDSYTYHAVIASQWIHEETLSTIIGNAISFQDKRAAATGEAPSHRNVIYDIVDTIERVLRYVYVKNLRAYNDVLAQVLTERGGHEQAKNLKPLHLFLECGASKPVTLSLVSLGLNRMSALVLSKKIILPGSASPEECLRLCRAAISNAEGLKLPATVRHEVHTFAGTS